MTATTSSDESFRGALSRLRQAQKPGGGVPAYTRWINRRVARLAAAIAYGVGLSPNGVTAISGLVSLAGVTVLVLLPVRPWSGLVVAGLLALGYVLDSADGQVARLSGKSSPAGEWLDHVVDAIRTPLMHAAVLLALFRDGHSGLSWTQVVALSFMLLNSGQFMSQILAEQLSRPADLTVGAHDGGGVNKSLVLLPTDTGVVCWMFALWGIHSAFAVVYFAIFCFHLLHAVTSMYRKYRKLSLKVVS